MTAVEGVVSVRAPDRRRQGVLTQMLRSPAGAIGLALMLLMVISALIPSAIAPGNPFDTSAGPALSPPSSDHIFGTDNLGRDVWTGIVHGARTSMTVVLGVVVLSSIIGVVLGVTAGYLGGIVDDVIMRIAELFQVVPRFFLALLVISFFGPSLNKLILLLGLTSWPFLARVVRAEALGLKARDFVEAARGLGASSARIVFRHVIPNLLPSVIVVVALFSSRVIMIESSLSFLGLGDPNKISWGFLASNARDFLAQAWWMALFPGIAIAISVFSLNLLGDSLNDALKRRR